MCWPQLSDFLGAVCSLHSLPVLSTWKISHVLQGSKHKFLLYTLLASFPAFSNDFLNGLLGFSRNVWLCSGDLFYTGFTVADS